MSKGSWQQCPYTGMPRSILDRTSDDQTTNNGYFRTNQLPDCNLFDVRSIAAACGYRDHEYFRRFVLTHPNCPIHVQRVPLVDDETDTRLGEIIATHQNSADYGGRIWHEMQAAAARDRGFASQVVVSSGSTV
jgi:hypothetical protein